MHFFNINIIYASLQASGDVVLHRSYSIMINGRWFKAFQVITSFVLIVLLYPKELVQLTIATLNSSSVWQSECIDPSEVNRVSLILLSKR